MTLRNLDSERCALQVMDTFFDEFNKNHDAGVWSTFAIPHFRIRNGVHSLWYSLDGKNALLGRLLAWVGASWCP